MAGIPGKGGAKGRSGRPPLAAELRSKRVRLVRHVMPDIAQAAAAADIERLEQVLRDGLIG